MSSSFPRPFLIALQFLTCIPVNLRTLPQDQEYGNSILFYPIVGLIIGTVLIAVSTLGSVINELLIAALILALWVIITGGLHLDGLSDTVDAWFGGLDSRDHTLEIMKDPHSGSMGIISLVVILLIKFAAINTVLINGHSHWLLISPVIARTLSISLILTTPYVRKEGIGGKLTIHTPKMKAWITCFLTLGLLILIKPLLVLTIAIASIGLVFLWRYLLVKRLGGYTGDTIGALIETMEMLSLVIIALY